MWRGYLCGVWVFSPPVYPSLRFAFHCLTNRFMWESVPLFVCAYVCVGVNTGMHTLVQHYGVCMSVSQQPEERNGPQQQTNIHTVADLSEVIVSSSKQTTGHYHTDAASVQM